MALTDYTTYAEVRAVLGVSVEELEDETLALPMYATNLELVLDDISESVADEYATIAAIAPVSRTALQQRYYDVVRMFSAYTVAKDLFKSLPMFSYKDLTDGRAEVSRFDHIKDVIDGVNGTWNSLLSRLQNLLAQIDTGYTVPTATTRVRVVGVGLATDPVTNA